MGTGFGCLEDGAIFIENLIAKDEAEPMPSRFPGSVHNAPAGNVAMDLGARGMNFTPTAGEMRALGLDPSTVQGSTFQRGKGCGNC